ncbi:hypothetical protein EMIT07CA2_10762 [Brevibacillus sp. IT-7CA2]
MDLRSKIRMQSQPAVVEAASVQPYIEEKEKSVSKTPDENDLSPTPNECYSIEKFPPIPYVR